MICGLPGNGVPSVLDPEAIRIPYGPQVRFDRESKLQLPLASARVSELVLDDHSRLTVRTELKALDLQAVQHRPVLEPIAVGVGDEFNTLRERPFLMVRLVRYRCPEPVYQLDRV